MCVKKIYNSKTLTLLMLFVYVFGFAQSRKTKNADELYDLFKFQKAIKAYKGLLRTDRKEKLYIYQKLGDAYKNIGEPENAEKYYAKAIHNPEIDPSYYFKYAMVLRQNQKYNESLRWMLTYKKKSGMSDDRLQEFLKEIDIVDKLLQKGQQADISNLDLNGPYIDYGGVIYQDSLIVYTTNNIKKGGKKLSQYRNLPFTDLYLGKKENNNYIKDKSFSPIINTGYHESSPTFNKDYTVMFFTRNNLRPGKRKRITDYNLKIYRSFYKDGNWTKAEEVHFDSNDYNCAHPTLSKDGKTLYFASDMPGTYGKSDIYKVSVNPDWTLGEPENMGKYINTKGSETFPFIDKNGNLFFSSDGHAGMGGLDIFVAFYINNNYIALKNLGLPYNSSKDDFAFYLMDNGIDGFLSSDRFGGKGMDDIYQFKNYDFIKPLFYLKGIVKTNKGEIIPNAKIRLFEGDKLVDRTISLPDGSYKFVIEPSKRYTLKTFKEEYKPSEININTFDIHSAVIVQDIVLAKNIVELDVCATDYDTNESLPDTDINIYEGQYQNIVKKTGGNGCLNHKISPEFLGKQLKIEVEARKDGYLPARVFLDTLIEGKKYFVDVKMVKFNLEPIHFDFDKSNIRPDARIILNRLVALMKKYPTMEISMESHTDARGTDEYNQALSERRAKSTMNYLIKHGIDASRLQARGFGETRIKNKCWNDVKCTPAEHQVNRRTEFMIIKI